MNRQAGLVGNPLILLTFTAELRLLEVLRYALLLD